MRTDLIQHTITFCIICFALLFRCSSCNCPLCWGCNSCVVFALPLYIRFQDLRKMRNECASITTAKSFSCQGSIACMPYGSRLVFVHSLTQGFACRLIIQCIGHCRVCIFTSRNLPKTFASRFSCIAEKLQKMRCFKLYYAISYPLYSHLTMYCGFIVL